MKDSLTSQNHQDFRARYGGTYGWLLGPKGRQLVYVDTSDHDFVYFTTGGETTFHAKANTGVQFEFIPVNRGWFNATDGNVWYLERVPARQWRRGICSQNTNISSSRDLTYTQRISYSLLASIFVDGQDNWAVKDYKKFPLALSRNFAILDKGDVFFYNVPIGSMKDGTITLNDNLYYQELSDLMRRKNTGIKVVVHD